MTWRLPVQQP